MPLEVVENDASWNLKWGAVLHPICAVSHVFSLYDDIIVLFGMGRKVLLLILLWRVYFFLKIEDDDDNN